MRDAKDINDQRDGKECWIEVKPGDGPWGGRWTHSSPFDPAGTEINGFPWRRQGSFVIGTILSARSGVGSCFHISECAASTGTSEGTPLAAPVEKVGQEFEKRSSQNHIDTIKGIHHSIRIR